MSMNVQQIGSHICIGVIYSDELIVSDLDSHFNTTAIYIPILSLTEQLHIIDYHDTLNTIPQFLNLIKAGYKCRLDIPETRIRIMIADEVQIVSNEVHLIIDRDEDTISALVGVLNDMTNFCKNFPTIEIAI